MIADHLAVSALLSQTGSERWIEVTNPADGALLGKVAEMGASAVAPLRARAQAALGPWGALGAWRRGEILQRWADLMAEHRADLATLVTLEQGKPITEAREEVDYALSFLRWFAEEGKRHYGSVIPPHKDGARMLTMRQPIGVTAAITPWNWPLAMITRKAGAALAAGCPMIVKPAAETSFCAIALENLAREAGVPPGVFQLVTGEAEPIVSALMADRSIRAVSFTGSTGVGKLLLRAGADTVKRMAMELGGLAPFIVFDDADLDAAVSGAMQAKFEAAGQSCTAINKALVHRRYYTGFCKNVAARAAALKVGNGLDETVQIGAITTASGLRKCQEHVEDALAKGARLLTGGKVLQGPGRFYAPTVLADVTPDMRLFREETFGPILPITPFVRNEDAIAMANDTQYGLAAYAYGRDIRLIWQTAEALEFGMIAFNTVSMTGPPVPFGGTRESGLGREGAQQGLEDFTEIKYLCLGGMADPGARFAGAVQ